MVRGHEVDQATCSHSKPIKRLNLIPSSTLLLSHSSQKCSIQKYTQKLTYTSRCRGTLLEQLCRYIYIRTRMEFECINTQVHNSTETHTQTALVFLSSGLYFTTGSGQATRALEQGVGGPRVHPSGFTSKIKRQVMDRRQV